MTSVSTYDLTYTRTHTATYLTEVILGTISDLLAHLGINASQLARDWDTNEKAISAWIAEGSLAQVVLECHRPSGTVAPVIEFPVTYTATGAADAEFTASRARLARFLAKLDTGSRRDHLPAVLHLHRPAHPAARLEPRHPGQHRRPAQHHLRHPRPRPARLSQHALPPPLRPPTMSYVDDAFANLKHNLEITQTEQDTAVRRHTMIRDYVTSRWDLIDDFLTGSYRRDTKTKKLKDIDIFVVIDPEGAQAGYRTRPPGDVLDALESLLAERWPGAAPGRDGRRHHLRERRRGHVDRRGPGLRPQRRRLLHPRPRRRQRGSPPTLSGTTS